MLFKARPIQAVDLMDASLGRAADALRQSPALLLVIGRSVGFVAAFAIPIVLSRTLDLAEFGTYKQLFLIYATLFGCAQLGMAESLYYFIPRDSVGAGRYIVNALMTLAAAGLACLILLMLSSGGIADWMMNPQLTSGLLPLGLFLAMTLAAAPFEIVLVSRRRHASAALTYAVSDVARVAFLVSPAVIFGTVPAVIWGAAGFAFARFGAMAWVLRRDLVAEFRPDVSMWRDQLAYAVPFALAVAVDVVQANYHQYVVATRFDAATFAVFAAAMLQLPVIDLIATSTANVMMVKMGGQGRNVRAALTLWHETIARLSLVTFPLAVFMFIAARDIIALVYTEAYLASVPLFQVSTLAILPMCLCVDAVLRAHAETRALFSLNLARLMVVATVIGWCLATFGLVGAMVATLVATVLARVLGLARIAQIMHVGIVDLLPWKRLALTGAIALAAAFPATLARDAVSGSGLIELSIAAAVYGAAFLLLWLPESSSLRPPARERAGGASPSLERRLPDAL